MSIKSILRESMPYEKWEKIARIKYGILAFYNNVKYLIFGKRISSVYDIPVFINNYNRLDYLRQLIDSLEKYGIKNIHIIDNDSKYPPLLEYYKSCKYDVIYLRKNVGYLSFWKTDLFKKYGNSYYIYTDPDVVIDKDCPVDFLDRMYQLLKKYPTCHKVGLGLRIDDLPNCYKMKSSVIEHESKFWQREISKGVYDAPVDTTFAMYRPYCGGAASGGKFAIRTGFPYVIKHLPWYIDTDNLTDEEKYYTGAHLIDTHWTKAIKESNTL